MFSVGIIQMEDPLQERVNYYNTELSKDYSNDEELLFRILFELFWETAINPATNDLIMNVFKSTHTSQEITIKDAFYYLFTSIPTPYTVINTYTDGTENTITKSKGERIISVLFLKFINYFALRILNLDTSSPELCKQLCEQLSNLADLVGLTDNERILNAAVIDIDNFLMITTESKEEIQHIIDAIHSIFIKQLQIGIPDNISIQITISVICKHKLKELKCPTVPDNTPKPKPKTDIKSWDEIMDKTRANLAAGITREIVKTEFKPLLTPTDETSKFRYAPPQQGIKKKKKPPGPIIGQQRPALSLPKAAPAAPVVLPTLSHRVPEAQAHNRGTHSKNKPKCPRGSDCYRKNPEHLREFYHHGRSPPPETKKHWRPGGGSGKSKRTKRRRRLSSTKRTRRRRLSTKRTRRRPSTKRSTKRR